KQLSRDGDFAVFDLPRLVATNEGHMVPSGTYRPVLTYFLPLDGHRPSREILVSMIPLDDLEKMAVRAQTQLLEDTREKFREMSLYPGGLVALLDGDGHVLVSGGDGLLPDGLDTARAEARQTGMAKVILPSAQGDMLCLLGSIRAFGWYVALTAPLDEIQEPSDSLLASLLAVSLPIMLLVALAALLMLIRTLRPLKLLTRKTRQLAEVDFAAPDALDRLEPLLSQGLPLERRDELGQLARAYAHLGGALATNIRNLMEATASKERMEGELSAAREIQMGILPPPDGAPEVCGFRASAFLDPAKEVGGDMYDFFVTSDGRRALVLGDVSGKGVPAALFMSMTVTLVRYALGSGLDPAAAMSQVNAMLEAHNPGNMFVTLFLALYDPQSGELSYANGGHCPPYIIDAASDAPPRTLDKLSGPLVGVMPDMEYTLFTDTLKEQETCLIFTDGVTEAMNSDKELYGEARLQDFLAAHRGASPRELLTHIFSELVRFRGEEPQSDDITMLAFCRTHSTSMAQPTSTARTSS
ncbi:MAG: SpoIIE family protein phosphatase, partial [Desulfovibrio piger]|nr:SpoIIE family protein phosphatase [Desulfovibrio piger]